MINTSEYRQAVDHFRAKNEGNYIFACQASVPLIFTPELIYQLWNNFKQYQYIFEPAQFLKISHIAVSDLLQSGLCNEIGFELYEIEKGVRDILLEELVLNLGEKRKNTIATFLQDFALLDNRQAYRKNLKNIHLLTAKAILNPEEMEKQIIEHINQAETDEEKINFLLLHNDLMPVGYESDLGKISKEVAGTKSNKPLSPILIAEENLDAPGVLKISVSLPAILKNKIRRISGPGEASLKKQQPSALQLIEKCLQTRNNRLELRNCEFSEADFKKDGKLDKYLRVCTHITTLIVETPPGFGIFPDAIGTLKNLRELCLGGLKGEPSSIQFIPRRLLSLNALQILDLSYNQLKELPKRVADMKYLKLLKVNDNQLKTLPSTMGELINLVELDISNNYIVELDDSILRLDNLSKLGIRNNPVASALTEDELERPAHEILQLLLPSFTSDTANHVKIFISYAHKDTEFLQRLELHLSVLRREGLINVWHAGNISSGENILNTIQGFLQSADIILLLISPDFLASDFNEHEMRSVIELHHHKKTRVIPILLSPTSFPDSPLAQLQSLPSNNLPVTSWANKDEAFVDIIKGIRKVVEVVKLAKSEPVIDSFEDLAEDRKLFASTGMEGIQEISPNRTLIALKLTQDWPNRPELVYDLRSIEDVFSHYRPTIVVEVINDKGVALKETIYFKKLDDFLLKNIVEQIGVLSDLMLKKDQYGKILRNLKQNKLINHVISDKVYSAAVAQVISTLKMQLPDDDIVKKEETEAQERDLSDTVQVLEKFGGFEFLESMVDGIENLNPLRKARRRIFLEEVSKEGERITLKKTLQAWMDVLNSGDRISDLIGYSQKIWDESDRLLKVNLRSVLKQTRDLEQSYRSVHLFYKNTERDKVNNVTFINAGLELLSDLDNTRFIDSIAEELKFNFDRLDLRNNYSLVIIPGYLGSEKIIHKWAKIIYEYKAFLITDYVDFENPDQVLSSFDAANLTGGYAYLSNAVMVCNWLLGRRKYDDAGETEDIFLSPAIALGGKMYSTLLSTPAAGKRHGSIEGSEGVKFQLKKSEISNLEQIGLIPMVEEFGKVVAYSEKTLFTGDNLGLQTYSAVRVFDYISKVVIDLLNRRGFEIFYTRLESDIRQQLVKFLDKIQGPGKLIEKFQILRFETDTEVKDVIYLDVLLQLYFPVKSFMIKFNGTKGDDGNEWSTTYLQQ